VETGETQVFDQKDIALTTATATPTNLPGANQDLKADYDNDDDDDDDDENYLPRLRSMK
jgi:hypothetical protein